MLDQTQMLEALEKIKNYEPDMYEAVEGMILHVAGCYSDKYQDGIDNGIDTKNLLYNPKHGKPINVYQVMRYLQRYITTDANKSELIVDIRKAIHYLLFELVRRIKLTRDGK